MEELDRLFVVLNTYCHVNNFSWTLSTLNESSIFSLWLHKNYLHLSINNKEFTSPYLDELLIEAIDHVRLFNKKT